MQQSVQVFSTAYIQQNSTEYCTHQNSCGQLLLLKSHKQAVSTDGRVGKHFNIVTLLRGRLIFLVVCKYNIAVVLLTNNQSPQGEF